ncbi:hypothetical protein SESBI_01084 [Sesbania bispinosa]|nr:hypothetical protein SESBI_01084 [Sesbania bispinosa]
MADEQTMNQEISKVQTITEERDKMATEITSLEKEHAKEKAEKLKAVVAAEKAVEALCGEREEWGYKEAWYQGEIENLRVFGKKPQMYISTPTFDK